MRNQIFAIFTSLAVITCADNYGLRGSIPGASLRFTDGRFISKPGVHEDFPVKLGSHFYYTRDEEYTQGLGDIERKVFHAQERPDGLFVDQGVLDFFGGPLTFAGLANETSSPCQTDPMGMGVEYEVMHGLRIGGFNFLAFGTKETLSRLCLVRLSETGALLSGPVGYTLIPDIPGQVLSIENTGSDLLVLAQQDNDGALDITVNRIPFFIHIPGDAPSFSAVEALGIATIPDVPGYGPESPYSLKGVPLAVPEGTVLLVDIFRFDSVAESVSAGLAFYNPSNGRAIPVLNGILPGRAIQSPSVADGQIYFSGVLYDFSGADIVDGDLYRLVSPKIGDLPEFRLITDGPMGGPLIPPPQAIECPPDC